MPVLRSCSRIPGRKKYRVQIKVFKKDKELIREISKRSGRYMSEIACGFMYLLLAKENIPFSRRAYSLKFIAPIKMSFPQSMYAKVTANAMYAGYSTQDYCANVVHYFLKVYSIEKLTEVFKECRDVTALLRSIN